MSKIKVMHINPEELRLNEVVGRRAFLGISLANPIVVSPRLKALVKWTTANFNPLRILIGDYIERHNIMYERGVDVDEATALATVKAGSIWRRVEEILQTITDRNIEVISSHDLVLRPRFIEAYAQLCRDFEQEEGFRASVSADVRDYIARKKRRHEFKGAHADAERHSVNYILEELAMFSLLVEEGFTIQIYPGRHLKTLVELANRRLASHVAGLNQLVCIDVSVPR